jgi:hypothetical protein
MIEFIDMPVKIKSLPNFNLLILRMTHHGTNAFILYIHHCHPGKIKSKKTATSLPELLITDVGHLNGIGDLR